MVRLQRVFPILRYFSNCLSIPLWCDCNLERCRRMTLKSSFNPTMVRLQLHIDAYHIADDFSFNPTMVRLQHDEAISVMSHMLPFNPTMVRLQPSRHSGIKGPPRCFQSHYGAIATAYTMLHPLRWGGLSIPLWCDCNPAANLTAITHDLLSIPLWCDCNGDGGGCGNRRVSLSIPLWCDCNRYRKLLKLDAQGAFNPTMVRLQQGRSMTYWRSSCFQSHYGAIATFS